MKNYQELASRTLIESPDFKLTDNEIMLSWCVIGLCGEVGEIAETVKHRTFHRENGGILDTENIEEEIGDLMWYVAAICSIAGISLEEAMKKNINKLMIRYPDGYNQKDSKLRKDKS
jgi:NTP pyrophosphatase (non-canonical NTP hydrolase)